MGSQISSDKLQQDESYRKVKEIQYNNVLTFVFENIRPLRPSMYVYYGSMIIFSSLIVYFGIIGLTSSEFSILRFGGILLIGAFAGSIMVIPFHEGLHGLAYYILGARKIHFGADMKQMVFYVAANKYVLGRKEFFILALTPFVVINITVLCLITITGLSWQITGSCFLFFHNIMCLGDFAMVNYFQNNKSKELYTYDDHENRISYIYEKIGA